MKKKKTFYSELAYVCGLLFLAFGTAMMEKADYGVSMVVAPAYLLYLRISSVYPFFTFGMAEYLFQLLLLVMMCVFLRRFKLSYLFSFCTALAYGFLLDASMSMVAAMSLQQKVLLYTIGLLCSAIGVALMFRTYISPEVYELFVKEISLAKQRDMSRVKTCYDIASCLLAITMSFAFFGMGRFEGIKAGTLICALVNGTLIGLAGSVLDTLFVFTRFDKGEQNA